MADEREQQNLGSADKDQVQTDGRKTNAAQPLDAAADNDGAERYPSVRQDDAVERTGRTEQVAGEGAASESRSFDPSADAPTREARPTTAEGDLPTSANEGRMGPGADPAEGKR